MTDKLNQNKIKTFFHSILRRLDKPYVVFSFISKAKQYIISFFVVLIVSIICYPLTNYLGYRSISFILFFIVTALAIFMGIGPLFLASALSALIWNFFFIPPHFTFHIGEPEDMLMFCMFFVIAFVNGVLTSRVSRQERLTRNREERTNALFQLTRDLAFASGIANIIKIAVNDIKNYFSVDTLFILQNGNNKLKENAENQNILITQDNYKMALSAFTNNKKTGKFTESHFSGDYTFYPLPGTSVKPGVVAVILSRPFQADREKFWETFLSLISNSIEREFLDELAKKARFLDESDRLYKTLFNSISHELRIPVAAIMGASETLLTTKHSDKVKEELSFEIFKACLRLNRLIENLLSMSRLESGRITSRLDWCDIHDLVNQVIDNLQEELKPFDIHIIIPDEMPLIKLDFGLMEQVLYNLVYNASQYSKPSTVISIKAYYDNGYFYLQVMDEGPGFPPEALPFVFNKFYRVEGSKPGGTGLGLSIVKGFSEAHKGEVFAENQKDRGACVTIKIPSDIPVIKEIL